MRRAAHLACARCRAAVRRGAAVFCAACLAPHHPACFLGHGRCATPGCDERHVVRPAPVQAYLRPGLLALGLAAITLAWALRATTDLRADAGSAWAQAAREARRARALEAAARAALDGPSGQLAHQAAAPELASVFAEAGRREARRLLGDRATVATPEEEIDAAWRALAAGQDQAARRLVARRLPAQPPPDRWGSHRDPAESLRSMELQLLITDGNRALRTLVDAIATSDLPRAEAGFAALQLVVADLRREEPEGPSLRDFQRNADALEARGCNLIIRARERPPAGAFSRPQVAPSSRPSLDLPPR